MMKELGYSLHARLIWDKENGVAPAFTVRYSHEYLLWFYKKGNMLKPCKNMRGKQTTVFREKATKLGGYQTTYFDKHGDVEEVLDQDLDYGDVSCCKCGNNGDYIQDIADWEEEDERD